MFVLNRFSLLVLLGLLSRTAPVCAQVEVPAAAVDSTRAPAPAVAIDETTKRLGIAKGDIDLYEINEAFAVVALAVAQKCGLDLAKVNVNGGAVALGHPIGASGARILTTLVHSLKARNVKRGLATLCIGGGEAVVVVVESV